jgi:hypothetical protein
MDNTVETPKRKRKPKQAEDVAAGPVTSPVLTLVPSPEDLTELDREAEEQAARAAELAAEAEDSVSGGGNGNPPPPDDADYVGERMKPGENRIETYETGHDGKLSVLLDSDTIENYHRVRWALKSQCKGRFPSFFSDAAGSSAGIVELTRDPATGAAAISAPWKRERLISRLNGDYRWMKLVKVKVQKVNKKNALFADEPEKEVWSKKQIPSCPELLTTGMWGNIPDIGLPILQGVKSGPFIDKNGRIVAEKGYDEDTGFYVAENVVPVLDGWTREKARDFLYDWLIDFPFDGDASRAHAIACFFLPFVRLMVDGATMMHAISAPASRSGKTLLAQTLMFPALGREVSASALPEKEEEAQKTVFADLLPGPDVLFYDNSKAPVSGAFLEAAITSQYPKARVLGASEMRVVPNHATWIITGSNIGSSADIANRSLRIHIDRGLADPYRALAQTPN